MGNQRPRGKTLKSEFCEDLSAATERRKLARCLWPYADADLIAPESLAYEPGGDGQAQCRRIAAEQSDEDLQEAVFRWGGANNWRIITPNFVWRDGRLSRNVTHSLLDEAARRSLVLVSPSVTLMDINMDFKGLHDLPKHIFILPVAPPVEGTAPGQWFADPPRTGAWIEVKLPSQRINPLVEQIYWIAVASHGFSKRQLSWLPENDQALVKFVWEQCWGHNNATACGRRWAADMRKLGRDDDYLLGNPLGVLGEETPWEPSTVPRPHRLVFLMHHCQQFRAELAVLNGNPGSADHEDSPESADHEGGTEPAGCEDGSESAGD